MHIANPIYDVVFKYLMEDSKIVKLVISSIIGQEIKELRMCPQEISSDLNLNKNDDAYTLSCLEYNLAVYRLDFSAKIKTPEGEKQVIIELQKAKFPTDIMRFRHYLGQQLSNQENTGEVIIKGTKRKVGLPIISIYFLGHKLDYIKSGAFKVCRQYQDLITGEIINEKEAFVESLTIDSYIIQIPYLSDKRRNDLELLLSVFDQSNAVDFDSHILNVEEIDFPAKYRPIIRKLQLAVLDSKLKKKMIIEDQFIDELLDSKREINKLEMQLLNADKEKEDAIFRAEKEKFEKEEALKIVEQVRLEKEKLLKELEELRRNK